MSEEHIESSIATLWCTHQNELKQQLIIDDSNLGFDLDDSKTETPLRLIGGVDISFFGDGISDAVAALVILNYPQLKIVHESYRIVHLTQPYVVGFLAFREVPHLMELIDDVKQNYPQFMPQLLLVDGNGVLHQRGFGVASHLGVVCNIPTIGVAKNLLYVDGLERDTVNDECSRMLLRGGDTLPLRGKSGTVWGTALRSTDDCKNHVYVSVGHRISLDTATTIVHKCCLHRIPEPIRCADLGSREYIRRYQQQQQQQQHASATTDTRTTSTSTSTTIHPIEYIKMNVANCYPPTEKNAKNKKQKSSKAAHAPAPASVPASTTTTTHTATATATATSTAISEPQKSNATNTG